MRVELEGRVIVVTGAASGVGAAVVRHCAQAGAAGLFVTDRDGAGLAATRAGCGVPVQSLVADLAEPAAPAAITAAALAAFGRIDGLVNAAALTDRAGLLDATMADWDALMTVNARAPFFLMQGALRDMVARGQGGAIVNILSVNARCGLPELAVYSAAKGALLVLTRNAANAHLAAGIRVNGINLGWTDTPSERRMQADVLGLGPGWLEAVAAGMPLKRLLHPDEAARLVLWLLSPQSAPMTGLALDLDQFVAGV